jgi:hypothetical protein
MRRPQAVIFRFMMTDETGNPMDIEALARTYGKAAIETIVKIMNGDDVPAGVRLSAARMLLDRGWGRTSSRPARKENRTAPKTRHELAVESPGRPQRDNPPPRYSERRAYARPPRPRWARDRPSGRSLRRIAGPSQNRRLRFLELPRPMQIWGERAAMLGVPP